MNSIINRNVAYISEQSKGKIARANPYDQGHVCFWFLSYQGS